MKTTLSLFHREILRLGSFTEPTSATHRRLNLVIANCFLDMITQSPSNEKPFTSFENASTVEELFAIREIRRQERAERYNALQVNLRAFFDVVTTFRKERQALADARQAEETGKFVPQVSQRMSPWWPQNVFISPFLLGVNRTPAFVVTGRQSIGQGATQQPEQTRQRQRRKRVQGFRISLTAFSLSKAAIATPSILVFSRTRPRQYFSTTKTIQHTHRIMTRGLLQLRTFIIHQRRDKLAPPSVQQ
jgi:hypothetical protein